MTINNENEQVIRNKQSFVSDQNMLLVILLLILISLATVAGFFVYLRLVHVEPIRIFPTTKEGYLLEKVAVKKPLLSDAELNSWLVDVITRAFSFNFTNIKENIIEVRNEFTDSGYSEFYLKILKTDPDLRNVIKKKQIVQAIPKAAPTINVKGKIQDIYSWKIELPINVTFYSNSAKKSKLLDLTILVQRVPVSQSIYGVQIAKVVITN